MMRLRPHHQQQPFAFGRAESSSGCWRARLSSRAILGRRCQTAAARWPPPLLRRSLLSTARWAASASVVSRCLLLSVAVSLASWTVTSGSAMQEGTFIQQRDDIGEYRLLDSLTASLLLECMAKMLERKADAASFGSGVCRLLACSLGASGCRKCRNADNSSLPLLWMRNKSCWKTFQHRVDGSVSFNRNWSEYANGFGQGESLNYWMGLEQLHQITATGVWRVRWEFSDWNGTWYWAENAAFSVGPAADNYRASMGPLDASRSSVGQLTFPDWSPNNQQFSTPETDNDAWGGNCALQKSTGWWFGYCAFINPNGVYQVPPAAFSGGGMHYYLVNSGSVLILQYSMKTFECLIRQ